MANPTKPRLFISFASEDKHYAVRIYQKLVEAGLGPSIDQRELQFSESLVQCTASPLRARDYILMLLSPNAAKNEWIREALTKQHAEDLRRLDVGILRVLLRDCDVSPDVTATTCFDLRDDFDTRLDQLVRRLRLILCIDFSRLNARKFESVVADLCTKAGYRSVEHAPLNSQVDLLAWCDEKVEGTERTEPHRVFIECKYYKEERPRLSSLQQLLYYWSHVPAGSKCLLFTTGQLTSAARRFVQDAAASSPGQVQVFEGPDLKWLLLSNPEVAEKHFVEDE